VKKSHVPDTFQFAAILPCSAFLASRKINKLRVFNTCEYSDPRLHHIKASVINKLQRCGVFQMSSMGVLVLEAGEIASPSLRPEPGIGSELNIDG
jgi:hypothetical protein